jgi:hypothetical protein
MPASSPRWLTIAAAALGVLAVAAVVAVHHYWPFTQNQIAQALQDSFNGHVTFQSFHARYFPHPGCVAEGVVFERNSRETGLPPFATVQRLTIEGHYLDVVLRPGVVALVKMEGLHLQVPPRGSTPEGEVAKTSANRKIGEVIANGAVLDILQTQEPPLRFEIRSAKLSELTHDGSLSYEVAFHNPLPPGEIESKGKFGPWHPDDPGKTPLQGRYKFTGADLSAFPAISGTLSSEDEFGGVLERIHAHGTVDVPDFELDRSGGNRVPLHATYQTTIDGTNGDVELEKVETKVAQTLVSANGRIAGKDGQRGKTVVVHFQVNQGRVQDLLRMFVHAPKSPMNGTTTIKANVVVPPDGRPFLQALQIDGEFKVENGHFTTPDTQSQIASLSHSGQGEKQDDAAKEDPGDTFSNLWGNASVRNGTATFTDLYFEVPGAKAHLHGTYGLIDQKINLHGKLGTDVKISQATHGFKSAILKPLDGLFKGKRHPGVVPVKLVGTYSKPEAGLDLMK